jgi:hypothetical protein
MQRLALLASGLALVLLTACQGPDRTGRVTRGFYSPDFDTLWEVAEREMQRSGFTPDRDASSKPTRTMVSRWTLSMSPFSGRGYREQATLTFHEVPEQPNRWTVESNVLREQNMAVVAPSNPVVAKWENPVRVPEKELLLTRNIEMFFLPRDVSPQFRAQYGMPPPPKPAEEERPAGEVPPSPRTR